MPIPWLDDFSDAFPAIEQALAEPNGLLAAGGDLSVSRLLSAYRQGIFPWYEVGQPILWWSPDPRLVLYPDQIRLSRSLLRLIRQQRFSVSIDLSFSEVVAKCAGKRRHSNGTWITQDMQQAYTRLHQQGYAHSVEVWQDDILVGGIYGVALGKVFFGESMFSKVSNTSKIALAYLARYLDQAEFKLIDCQVTSPHLISLGAVEISRTKFKKYLQKFVDDSDNTPDWRLQSDIFNPV